MNLCAKRKVIFEENRSDLKKRGKICKLSALIEVRIVKVLDLEALCFAEDKISGNFCF